MNICIPITSKKMPQILKDIKKAEKLTNFIELRLDLYKNPDLKKLIKSTKNKIIVTDKRKNNQSNLKEAIKHEANYIDIDYSNKYLNKLIKNKKKTKIIVSTHQKNRITFEKIDKLYSQMAIKGIDIIKIVFPAKNKTDTTTILDYLKYHNKKKRKPIILFCTGKKGISSRVFSPLFGGFLTFASLEKGKESAKGQIPIENLLKIYTYLKVR